MNREPIFLKPVLQERIWGGEKLREMYGYEIPSSETGEAWVISAHPNGPSVIKNGILQGKTLAEAWASHGELFNKAPEEKGDYPLLVKLLDANDNLSVQVHPGDTYAQKIEGVPFGKTECWYVVSAEEKAELIIGHHAKTRDEFEKMMTDGAWDALLKRVPVKAGDFVHVPSGTIHAIGRGIVILEIQQSSDITYRLYDYDRIDNTGNKRGLHLEKSAEVTSIPDERDSIVSVSGIVEGDVTSKKLVEDPYFTVVHYQLDGEITRKRTEDFYQVNILTGTGEIIIDNHAFLIEKGMHFIIPHTVAEYVMRGKLEYVVSWV